MARAFGTALVQGFQPYHWIYCKFCLLPFPRHGSCVQLLVERTKPDSQGSDLRSAPSSPAHSTSSSAISNTGMSFHHTLHVCQSVTRVAIDTEVSGKSTLDRTRLSLWPARPNRANRCARKLGSRSGTPCRPSSDWRDLSSLKRLESARLRCCLCTGDGVPQDMRWITICIHDATNQKTCR